MKNIYHTHYCKELDSKKIGEEVTVSGWIENIRDHGGVLFLDLRDNTEIIQVVSGTVDFPKEPVVVLLQGFVGVNGAACGVACKELDGLPLFGVEFFNGIVVVGDVATKAVGPHKNVLLEGYRVFVDKMLVATRR